MKKIALSLLALLLLAGGAVAQKSQVKKSKKKDASIFVDGRQKIREKDVTDEGDSVFYSVGKFTPFNTKDVKFYYTPYDYGKFKSLSVKSTPDWGCMQPAINFLSKVSRAPLQMCLIYAVNPDVQEPSVRDSLSKIGRNEANSALNSFKAYLAAKGMRNKAKYQIAEIDYRYFKGANYYNEMRSEEIIHVGVLLYFGTKKKAFFPEPTEGVRTFPDIKFFPNDATIVDSWYELIDELADYLKENERKGVLLVGHADNQGTEEYSKGLSRQRAMEVVKALQMRGIDAVRIEMEARGSDEPVGDNDTYEGRIANNRVSIKIQ